MKTLSLFLMLCLFACDGRQGLQTQQGQESPNNNGSGSLSQEVASVAEHFCKGQKVQVDVQRKVSEYQQKGQTPPMELMTQLDESNKHMEAYTTELDALMKKYKGQERKVYNMLKEKQLNCKW